MNDASSALQPDWDLFCRVVDNFGDIGVCWRLARDVACHHGLRVRLWVDDWAAFVRLCPAAAKVTDCLVVQGVEVHRWRAPWPVVRPAGVVIEAFACELPEAYVAAMAARHPRPVWINLEYLSAEAWVSECHRLASPHPRLPLVKYFFFPGFAADTGGLLREPDLLAARDRWQRNPEVRAGWLAAAGIGPVPAEACLISLFSYEQPALGALLAAWTASPRPVWLVVPQGRVVPQLAAFFGEHDAAVGQRYVRGALTAIVLPFLTQDDYDRLLWACDLNFVRGEDSFVRAQWAARPFVWHIYAQQDDAHRAKLEAFLERYVAALEGAAAEAVRGWWRAWNGEGEVARHWAAFAGALPQLRTHARRWADALATAPDLATSLVHFCAERVE
jgi:uncharacterized repeat protein (TIGR03837 family)